MGKSQKKRAMRRHNPIRVPDSHLPKGLGPASATSSKTEEILPILQKMASTDAAERKWACVAVSNLIQNDPATRRLLQGKNVVGALITRLSDDQEEVVVEAAGALRNLCIDAGYDICAEMYNKNIIAPLTTLIPKISTTLSQYIVAPKDAPENVKNAVYDLAENVITILWCLSETSNKALSAVNQMSLVPFLMAFLDARDKLPLSTVIAAAHCLYVLSEDNYPVSNRLRAEGSHTSCLFSIVDTSTASADLSNEKEISLRILACGILRNISPLPNMSLVDLDRTILLPWLEPVLSSVSLSEASQAVSENLVKTDIDPPIEKLSLKGGPRTDHKTTAEVGLERIERKLRTLQLALEVMTGLCATLPDPEFLNEEGDEELEEEGEEDEPANEDVDATEATEEDDVQMDTEGTTAPNGTSKTSTSSSNSFLKAFIDALLRLSHPTPLSFPPPSGTSPHPPATSALSSIHISALECLNNVFLSLASAPEPSLVDDVESGKRVWDMIWAAMALVGLEFGPGQERRRDMWHVAAGVMWGVGIIWKGSLVPDAQQISLLMQLCQSTEDIQVRVRCIGALECLAQHPTSIEGNKVISEFLLSLLPNSTTESPAGTEPLIQAASALIDIYSDENMPYDVNFRKGKYAATLTKSLEGFRRALKGIDKKREGGRELRRRGDEVLENLEAFIVYRRGLKL